MTEKRRCPNCGAYLTNSDETCYVCGEVLTPETMPKQNASDTTYEPIISEPNTDNDFTKTYNPDEFPSSASGNRTVGFDKDTSEGDYSDSYIDENDRPYFYDEDADFDDKEKNNTKKTAIICGIIVGVVAIAAVIVGVCFAMGLFPEKSSDEVTVYFDKPSVSLNLMDEDGTVYNWGADVSVGFKMGNKEQQQSCNLCLEYDNMWKCTIPADATDVYFFQDTGEEIRTAEVKFLENDTVYYVTEILFNADGQLPISSCKLNEFDNLGVNATEETTPATTKAKATTAPTEKPTEKETEPETETEKPTEALSNPYNISVPSSWTDGAIEITNDNCVSYYETYNYQNYGTGMLLSIYTFKAGDNSYGDLNAKKILTASDGSKVVIVTPSDVQFDDGDETATNNYISLSNLTNQVIKSIKTN